MGKAIGEQVVVITGASSGIGRETALAFAEKGATLILAARDAEALDEVAEEATARGAEAVPFPTDVSSWADVEALAGFAADQYGRIDTWVNNAAVSEYGLFADMPPEDVKRVIDVTLMGQIFGTKAALNRMRHVGGTIINVASVVADVAVPLQAPYVAAKHGIRGFTESLRLELAHEGSPVTVTLVMPASIDTPFFSHARSRLGAMPASLPPVYGVGLVADAIVRAAAHPVRAVSVGGDGLARARATHGRTSPAGASRVGPAALVVAAAALGLAWAARHGRHNAGAGTGGRA